MDPADDSIRRFVLCRYAYDPLRHERRNQVVAAFDDVAEFEQEFERAHRTVSGIDADERWSGTVKEPGHDRRARAEHLVRRCIEHGVVPPDELLRDLPSGAYTSSARDEDSG